MKPIAYALSCLAIAGVLLATGCTDRSSTTPHAPANENTKKYSYADGGEGLQKLLTDMMEAGTAKNAAKLEDLANSLVLSDADAYFGNLFGEKGAAVAKAYNEQKRKLVTSMVEFFGECAANGKTNISAIKAEGDHATGAQRSAMAAMTVPVTLWTGQLTKPGETSGTRVWSFAFVDGNWRLLGKMHEIGRE